MTLIILTIVIAHLFAFNIGGSGAAATMGIPYGTQAIKNRRLALFLCGIGGFLGAAIGGEEVAKTLSGGLIPSSVVSIQVALIILVSATLILFFTNWLGIPLSTSEVTVGAIVGVGLSFHTLNYMKLFTIILFWLSVPVVSFILSFILVSILTVLNKKLNIQLNSMAMKLLSLLLIGTGLFEAFSAGMNNVANAIGPLIGAGIFPMKTGLITGAICMMLGSFLLGSKVLETNGKKISELSLGSGVIVSGISGVLVFGASILGMPVPMTQVTTSAIVGVGAVNNSKNIWKKPIVRQILKVWVTSPVVSLVVTYLLSKVLLQADFYTVFIVASVILVTIMIANIGKSTKKANITDEEIG